MAARKHDLDSRSRSRKAFLVPLAWIAALLASYWLLADWQAVPEMISAAVGAIL